MPNSGTTLVTLVAALLVILGIGLRVIALGVIPGNRKPSTGMAWLLAVLLWPVVGTLLFVVLGRARLERTRHERQQRVNDVIAQRARAVVDDLPDVELPDYLPSVVWLNRTLGSLPLLGDNTVELLPDYADTIRSMAEAVEGAERFVHVEFYITAWDDVTSPLFDAMSAAAARGVDVCLLFDHLGSKGIPGFDTMVRRLGQTGIRWHEMLPIAPLRGKVQIGRAHV